jgi:NACHT domain
MYSNEPEFAMVIKLVQKQLPADYQLSEPQRTGIKAAWEGKGYKHYAANRCTPGHIGNVMMPVFAMLSESLGMDVRKSNFRRVIEELMLGRILIEEDPNKPPIIGSPPKGETFLGRNYDKNIIYENLNDKKIILLNGSGGIGKTSLAAHVFKELSKTKYYEKYIWFAIHPNSVNENLIELLKGIGISKTTSPIDDFLDYVAQNKVFIVIDGLDILLSNYLNEVNNLIKRIIDRHHYSLIVITCSQSIYIAKNLQKQEYPILNYKLEGLEKEDSRELFYNQGLLGKEVDDIIDASRGIPSIILDACHKIKLFGGDFKQYIKNKTKFIANSAKDRLNNLFINKTNEIQERERYILFYLAYKVDKKTIAISNLIQVLEANTRYTSPEIIDSLEILEHNALISIERSSVIKYDEVTGYVVQDPISLFRFE